MPRQFQWINANGYPVLYTTDGITSGEAAAELRNAYDRMQYGGVAAQNGMLESTTQSSPAYPQYMQQQQQQQGQGIAATVSSPSYMTALPATTLMHVNSGVNFTTANNAVIAATTFTDAGAMRSVVPLTKMPYATATLGRPPRHPGLMKGSEPSICAQVSQIQYDTESHKARHVRQRTETHLRPFPPSPPPSRPCRSIWRATIRA